MIHYACDRCKRVIDPDEELRYVVKMEVQAVVEPGEVDDECDHLMEVHEILESQYGDPEHLPHETHSQKRYDLCPNCYAQFIKNPIGGELAAQLGFSSN